MLCPYGCALSPRLFTLTFLGSGISTGRCLGIKFPSNVAPQSCTLLRKERTKTLPNPSRESYTAPVTIQTVLTWKHQPVTCMVVGYTPPTNDVSYAQPPRAFGFKSADTLVECIMEHKSEPQHTEQSRPAVPSGTSRERHLFSCHCVETS